MTAEEEHREAEKTNQLPPDYWLEQLAIYARDVGELYRAEQEARQKLAEEKIVLEYKIRELEALNQLFTQHLERKRRVEETLSRLLSGLRSLVQETRPEVIIPEIRKLIAMAERELEERA